MRSRTTSRRHSAGFTFTELIAIVVIIGLLAAIAIPMFVHHRARADDGAAKSLVRTAQSAVEAAYAETRSYPALTPAEVHATEPALTFTATGDGDAADDTVAVAFAEDGYRITTTSRSGTRFTITKDTGAVVPVTRTCGTGCTW